MAAFIPSASFLRIPACEIATKGASISRLLRLPRPLCERCRKRQAILPFGELETNFDEFSTCSDAEPIIGGMVRVSALIAPRGILLVVHMANDFHADKKHGCADDKRHSYQTFPFHLFPLIPPTSAISSSSPTSRRQSVN